MDSEPGRCKRTDGRKWRCCKNVVPLQKYCERHMHRGRQGSRKHVEPIERVSRHGSRTSDDSRMPVMSLVASTEMDDRVSISPYQQHSSYRSGFPAVLKCRDDKTRDALLVMKNSTGICNIGNGSKSVDYARSSCSSSKSSFANPTSISSSRKQNVVGLTLWSSILMANAHKVAPISFFHARQTRARLRLHNHYGGRTTEMSEN